MSTPPTPADLQKQYSAKLATYNSLMQTTLKNNDTSKISQLQTLNKELNQLLETLMNTLHTYPTKIQVKREELVETLRRIQRDYGALRSNTDTLTRLRLIREGETTTTWKEFYLYFGIFLALCLGILGMVFLGGQIKEATAMSATTPTNTAPFA
jgi:hypothetical protein